MWHSIPLRLTCRKQFSRAQELDSDEIQGFGVFVKSLACAASLRYFHLAGSGDDIEMTTKEEKALHCI